MGSGHITHNLGAVFGAMRHGRSSPEMAGQVSAFVEWTEQKLIQNDMENLLDWENQAPFAKVNHPTSEHFLPLFFSAGAGQLVDQTTAKAKLLHRSTQFGMFTSDIWRFD